MGLSDIAVTKKSCMNSVVHIYIVRVRTRVIFEFECKQFLINLRSTGVDCVRYIQAYGYVKFANATLFL